MVAYYNQKEIKNAIKDLMQDYLKTCTSCEELPEDFIDLIKHNFLAKYVSYNAVTNSIEIGIEDANEPSSLTAYPQIKVYTYPISDKKNKWLDKSFKKSKPDLAFYGRLLNRRSSIYKRADVVVM